MSQFEISSDTSRLDVNAIHDFLNSTYWAARIPRPVVERAIKNSLCVGAYCDENQVGFARVVTDKATFAYVADVFVVEQYRGKGIARGIMQYIINHPDLVGLRRMMLITRDAHGLYEKLGFKRPSEPDNIMERRLQNPYGAL